MRKRAVILAGVFMTVAVSASAAIFSAVKGVVHDPQDQPVAGATVTIKARTADRTQTTKTDNDGTFQFAAVSVGEYTIAIVSPGFITVEQPITVISDTTPIVRIQLQIAAVQEAVTVSASPVEVHPDSVTPTTLVSRRDIQYTPGADRTNGLEMITAYVPGAYVTHDQLHVRGGHQVNWLIDGVPVPNTNVASNIGPQLDPKDIDFLEVHRGSYDAEYGDRTYGVFNIVPRSGFERNNDAEVVLLAGAYSQVNGQLSAGGHTDRFAYFVSANGNQSDLGLGTPVADIIHDRQTGASGLASLIFNIDPSNQLRVVTSVRQDNYQIPNTPEDQAAGISDVERESDAFVNASWVRTLPAGMLLTVSPFFHFNAANYEGGSADPIVTVVERGSQYGGAQATFTATARRNDVQVGFYGFHQQDNQLFALTFNDGSNPNLSQTEVPSGNLAAVFVQDKFAATSWLTLTGGVRQTYFSGGITESATSPRVGAALQVPFLNWVVRGFWGRFYQAPPLLTVSGPLLQYVTVQNLGFIPLHGERDEEYQVGVAVPFRGWVVDVDHFQTTATNYFDHNPVGNSNVFFPITIDGALIRGTEVTVRSPRTWLHGQFHLAYAYQTALGQGSINGGLTAFSSGGGYFPLDHDQRHTLSAGFDVTLPRGVFEATNVYYGSGFTDNGGPAHLPGHTTVDLTVGKSFSDKVSVAVTALNIANSHLLIDNSLTFGGTHFNNPREVYGEFRFRFHY
jgi:outer membrane receptor for ferrienterochelin and colicin